MTKKQARRNAQMPLLLRSVGAEELLAVIRRKCRECCCGSKKMVKHCKTYDCALYPYRCCFVMVQTDFLKGE